MTTNNESPIKWQPLSLSLQLPRSLELTTPAKTPNKNGSVFYKPGYAAFSYLVSRSTNVDNITLPLIASADFFDLDETTNPPSRFVANKWIVTVTNLSARSTRTSYIPTLAGSANLIDKRFTNVATGNSSLVYSEKKATWLDRKDPKLQEQIETKSASSRTVLSGRKPKPFTKVFVLAFLALSTGGLVFMLVKNKKTNKE